MEVCRPRRSLQDGSRPIGSLTSPAPNHVWCLGFRVDLLSSEQSVGFQPRFQQGVLDVEDVVPMNRYSWPSHAAVPFVWHLSSPKEHTNTRILESGSQAHKNADCSTHGMVCRSLMFLWPVGPLKYMGSISAMRGTKRSARPSLETWKVFQIWGLSLNGSMGPYIMVQVIIQNSHLLMLSAFLVQATCGSYHPIQRCYTVAGLDANSRSLLLSQAEACLGHQLVFLLTVQTMRRH